MTRSHCIIQLEYAGAHQTNKHRMQSDSRARACLGLWPATDQPKLVDEISQLLPVPSTFLLSRDYGLVNCDACRDLTATDEPNIEINGPHELIARNPEVMTITTQRLAKRFET